jgi:hypothetical protein
MTGGGAIAKSPNRATRAFISLSAWDEEEEEEEGVGLGSSDANRWGPAGLVEMPEFGESGATTGEQPLKREKGSC